MAITPADIYAPQSAQTGLMSIFQRGTGILSNSLQNAIQMGRDASNNALQQERDFLAERSRLDQLGQRRAENLQQQMNFDRQFAEGAFRDRRDFAAGEARFDRQMDRQEAMDAFSRGRALAADARADAAAGRDAERLAISAAGFYATQAARDQDRLLALEDRQVEQGRRFAATDSVREIDEQLSIFNNPDLPEAERNAARISAQQIFNRDILTNPAVTSESRRLLAPQIFPSTPAAPSSADINRVNTARTNLAALEGQRDSIRYRLDNESLASADKTKLEAELIGLDRRIDESLDILQGQGGSGSRGRGAPTFRRPDQD